MDLKYFKDKLFSEAKIHGFESCEVYYSSGSSFSVMVRNGNVEEYKNTESGGLSFRGVFDGKMGYSYTENPDVSVIPILIENARQNAEIIESAEPERLFAGSGDYMQADSYCKEQKMTPEEKIEMAKKMEAHALGFDKRIKSIIYCMVSNGENEIYISNTLGLELSHKSSLASAFCFLQAEENGQVKVGGEFFFGKGYDSFSPETIAKTAAEKALSNLGAKSVPSKKYPIVLDRQTAADFFSCFEGVFHAEKVQKGFSLLKDKLNTQIANECITLRDDGVYEKSPGNTPFDSEGVATTNKAVIENGVLKTYLYNLKSAEKDGAASTGNGFKPSFRSPVGTGSTNFYIVPSNDSLEALFLKMGNGLYINKLSGLHSGANAVSGNFSLSADGFLVEGGKIMHPVEQITVAGNFFELLKDIIAVGSDLLFCKPGAGGFTGMPSLFIKELSVSGL